MPENNNDNQFKTMEDFLGGTNTPTDPAIPPVEETTPPAEETTPPAGDVTPPAEETTPPAGDKETKKPIPPNPMKELRDKANAAAATQKKIDDAINRLSDGEYEFKLRDFKTEEGKMDYDALIKAMDEADVKKRADSRGLSPELQAEIEKYEREKKEVEMAKARVQMDRQLNNFQMEQQLNSEDLNNFIADSMKIGINPLSIAALDKTSKGTTALKMLYKAVYTDKIVKDAVDKALADAEAKRQADAASKGNQPKPHPANPNNNTTGKPDSKGLALNDFLKSL